MVRFLVVYFLYKTKSQPPKNYLLWEKVAQMPQFFLDWVGLYHHIHILYSTFELCLQVIDHPSLEEGGAERNPGADLHSAPFQHPYTRKSTTTPSGVHSMFVGLPMVETSHLPHTPSRISTRHICHELSTHQYSLPSKVDFPGCSMALPTRFGLCPFEPSLPFCAISAHDPWHHLDSGALVAALLFDFHAQHACTTRPSD